VLVNPDVTYALVEASISDNTNKYIIAKEQIDELFLHKINVNGYRVITTMSGKELKASIHMMLRCLSNRLQ
jgi:isoleucyl-tRNA synthetase